jgi:hypothetical protein
MEKIKEDTNIKVKVEETNDECKITIINKLYSEGIRSFNATIGYLKTCQNNQKLINTRILQVRPSLLELWLQIHTNNLHNNNK